MIQEIICLTILTTILLSVTHYVVKTLKLLSPKEEKEKLPAMVFRYTSYKDYLSTCSKWSGHEPISSADLSSLGFTGISSELLYNLETGEAIGGFSLAIGVIEDWPIIRESEYISPLIDSKYMAIDIIVADEHRKKGLADYMVRKIIQSYGPYRHLMWNASNENEASLKLAKRYGFVAFATTVEEDNSTITHLIRKAGGL